MKTLITIYEVVSIIITVFGLCFVGVLIDDCLFGKMRQKRHLKELEDNLYKYDLSRAFKKRGAK